ncbi:MAG: hypothetical protein AVDCRST_MAG88-3896, partial [uncultured Thermomicrobiales bacterium]
WPATGARAGPSRGRGCGCGGGQPPVRGLTAPGRGVSSACRPRSIGISFGDGTF